MEIGRKPSKIWYLAPFFLLIIGGIIMYFACRNDDRILARNGIVFGIIWTVIVGIFWILVLGSIFSSSDNGPEIEKDLKSQLTPNQLRSVEQLKTNCENQAELAYLQSENAYNIVMKRCADKVEAKIANYIFENNKSESSMCGKGTIFDSETNSCIIDS